MFERFTESARQVVVHARDEARALGHGHIGTEHLLLGLLCEGAQGIAGRTLGDFGVTADAVRAEVAREGEFSGEEGGRLPFTPDAKKLLERALREALMLGHNYIGTEHILLAVAADGDLPAARILGRLADPQAVRDEVVRKLSGGAGQAEQAGDPRQATPAPADPRGTSTPAARADPALELPDLAALSDEELDELIDRLVDEESRLLYEQGALQGKLDVLCAQRDHRRRRQGGGGSTAN